MKTKRGRALLIAFGGIIIFVSLMVYALKADTEFVPSQLVNKPAPAFVAPIAQGGELDLKSIAGHGRWVVLNFWSTTCIVCRYEAPELESFYMQTQSNPQTAPIFVSINIQEGTTDILNYAKNFQLSYPIVSDKSGKISLDYGVTGTPETFFIDPHGVVRHRVAGEVDRDSIFRFIDWLDKNPDLSPEEALKGYAAVRRTM